ncbi:hypothetical protein PROFUN_02172 [Planoprotostelium fungivorum]|uniref:Alcohol dehydrogenase-like C-terminal domain-containing protein n=1 Tax=Planoprotostelium fungivorum TaxID=1890364 RepID=A0A2P6NZF2_9EUKA|nr:hypothetical protein PROFUN_02172 [Planoprotostelium fungivorum]
MELSFRTITEDANYHIISSSDEKLAKCKELGANDTINHQKTKNWGEVTNGRGVDHIIELGGFATLQQSLAALKIQGQVHIIGFIAGSQVEPYDVSFEIYKNAAHVRSYLVGHKKGLERFVAAIENKKIKPVIDRVFTFDQTKDAYEYLLSQKHVGKIVIKKTFLPERERKPEETFVVEKLGQCSLLTKIHLPHCMQKGAMRQTGCMPFPHSIESEYLQAPSHQALWKK